MRNSAVGVLVTAIQVIAGSACRNFHRQALFSFGLAPSFQKGPGGGAPRSGNGAQNYLQNLMGIAAEATSALPLIPDLLNPDRWLLWLGVLFVLSVYFFPSGIVGRLRGAS